MVDLLIKARLIGTVKLLEQTGLERFTVEMNAAQRGFQKSTNHLLLIRKAS